MFMTAFTVHIVRGHHGIRQMTVTQSDMGRALPHIRGVSRQENHRVKFGISLLEVWIEEKKQLKVLRPT